MTKKIILAALIIFAVTAISFAQQAWTLKKCIETAWQNNLSIKTAQINLKSTEIDITQAKHARYPNLSASSNVFWNFGRTIDPATNTFTTSTFFNNGINLNTGIVLFNGFNIKNSISQSELNNKATQKDIAELQNTIALNVATNYLNALFAKENLSIAKSNLTLSQNTLNQTEILVKSGARAANEILDIQAQLANDEQGLIVAQNNYNLALLQLKQLMLTTENIDVDVPENIELKTKPDLITVDEIYNTAIVSRPEINAAELRVASSEYGVKIAQGQKYPSINIGGQLGTNYSNQAVPFLGKYADQLDNNLSYGAGFSLNVPILTNYRTPANIQKAKLSTETAKLNLETAKQNVRVLVQQAYADAKAAEVKLQAAEKSLEAQQLAYDNANKKFQIGTINSFDLSNSRTRLDNAKNNLLIAKYDHIFRIKILDFYMGRGL